MNPNKPINYKSYGSIGHLPKSRMGPSDSCCSEGQARIATEQTRDKHDRVIVQEKLDGGNVGVIKLNNEIIPLTRSGYTAISSLYEHHLLFHEWVIKHKNRFQELLMEEERICGEWMLKTHGTRYDLPHEPFVAFDLMTKHTRLCYDDFKERVDKFDFITPKVIHIGGALTVEEALKGIEVSGHGACDPVEGCVWRVERNAQLNNNTNQRTWKVDFLVKYVRPDKEDGLYMKDLTRYNTFKDS